MLSDAQIYLHRMNDGRHFTDWTPRGCQQTHSDATPAHVAKNRMIETAEERMTADRRAAALSVGVSPEAGATLQSVPGFEVTQFCDARACAFAPVEDGGGEKGVGLGRREG